MLTLSEQWFPDCDTVASYFMVNSSVQSPAHLFFIDRSLVGKLFCQCSVRILPIVHRTSHALPAKYSCPGCAHSFAATLHKALCVSCWFFQYDLDHPT